MTLRQTIAVTPLLWFTCIASASADETFIEEIVVTADFRQNNLMKNPDSVTIINDAVIRDRGAQHLESILNLSPNISYSSGASRARFIQIRGVGDLEQFVDPKHFPSVGISVDEIDLGGNANAAMLFDTHQVEIMRGPQGTRFGTGALAGIINILTNEPTNTFESNVSLGAGNYGSWNIGGVVSGPLTDRLSTRLAIQQNQGNGYIDNRFLGKDDTNGYDELSIRAKLHFEASDRASYNLTVLRFDGENGYDAYSLDNNRDTLSDQPGHDNQETTAVAAKGVWTVNDNVTIQSSVTWLDSNLEYGFDEDWSFVGICDGTLCDPVWDFYSNTDNYTRDRREIALDLRLLGGPASLEPSDLHYVIGVFAQRRDEDLHRMYYGDFFSKYETDRNAVYGQIETAFTDQLTLTLGLRFEEFDDSYHDSSGLVTDSDDELWSGEISLAYETSANTLLYATLSRGTRAGTVNTEASANFPFMQPVFQSFMADKLHADTETLINREVGLKARVLDNRLSLRIAAFHVDRNDSQLESWMWDGVSFLWVGFLDNVDATNYGVEIESSYAVNDRLTVFASLGLLESEIDSITTFDLDLSDFVTHRNLDQAKSPSWQFNAGFNLYVTDALSFRMDVEGREDSRYGYYHNATIDDYTLVNASLSYHVGRFDLQLWGRNLTDEDYAVHGLYFGNDPRKGWVNENYKQYGEPLVVGFSVNVQL